MQEEKKRIKPDFAQFYMQSPVFDVSVDNNLNVEMSIVARALCWHFGQKGAPLLRQYTPTVPLSPLIYLKSSLNIKPDFILPYT